MYSSAAGRHQASCIVGEGRMCHGICGGGLSPAVDCWAARLGIGSKEDVCGASGSKQVTTSKRTWCCDQWVGGRRCLRGRCPARKPYQVRLKDGLHRLWCSSCIGAPSKAEEMRTADTTRTCTVQWTQGVTGRPLQAPWTHTLRRVPAALWPRSHLEQAVCLAAPSTIMRAYGLFDPECAHS